MTVGWYVHHHGAGHLHRFLAVRPFLPGRAVGLSSLPRPACVDADEWVGLPLDLPADDGAAPTAGGVLHWAPLRCAGLRDRMARIAAWLAEARPDVVVVDVSVEVALLVRLHGVPVVVVGQRGVRVDPPHQAAYAAASAVVAPWTAATHLAGDGLPDARMAFAGAVTRFDALTPPGPAAPGGDVLVLVGSGGHGLDAAALRAAADATPGRTWHVAGPLRIGGHPRVVDHGPAADVWTLLGRASVVVGTAGGNVVGEVAAARRAFVCLPQERPFAEQDRQAEALRRLGVAEVVARDAVGPELDWPALLAAAEARDVARWSALHDGRGAQRLAEAVAACA